MLLFLFFTKNSYIMLQANSNFIKNYTIYFNRPTTNFYFIISVSIYSQTMYNFQLNWSSFTFSAIQKRFDELCSDIKVNQCFDYWANVFINMQNIDTVIWDTVHIYISSWNVTFVLFLICLDSQWGPLKMFPDKEKEDYFFIWSLQFLD